MKFVRDYPGAGCKDSKKSVAFSGLTFRRIKRTVSSGVGMGKAVLGSWNPGLDIGP